ncbi:MAG TPA: DEAD/DEAH box helicase [Thermoprotei archaeon]|nr:DEAD/DEAH box helicase [Thermoprotei archaeon]
MTNSLEFYIKRWLTSEEFRRLLGIGDYVGRFSGKTVMRLSLNKVLEKGYTVDDILSILEDVGAEYSPELIDYLEKRLEGGGSVTLTFDGEKIYAKFSTYLGKVYTEKLKDILKYDHKAKMFYTYPYLYGELVGRLKDIGYSITDLTGFNVENPLPVKLTFKGELRDYQVEAIDHWMRNRGRGIIALPTGSGKTVIGVASIARLNQRTLIIAYTKEQLMQWRRAILSFTDAEEILTGLYYSKEKRIAPITLATYQTAYKYMGTLSPYFSLLIIDEVHHLPAQKFKYIATMSPATYRMGLSATPYREDGKHTYLFPLMGGVVYYKTPSELAEKGYLAKYRIVTVKVKLTPEEQRRYNELREKFRRLAGQVQFDKLVEAAKRGDWRAIHALRIHSEMRQITQRSVQKIRKAKEIVEKEMAGGKKVIIFAHYVELAEKLASELNAYLLTGSTPDDERRRILEEFRSSKGGVLVVTTVGDEGLDIPDASVGVLVAGTGSRRQFIQRLGRILRPGPGKEAVLYEIIVKGTSEEAHSRRRKRIRLDELANIEQDTDKKFP